MSYRLSHINKTKVLTRSGAVQENKTTETKTDRGTPRAKEAGKWKQTLNLFFFFLPSSPRLPTHLFAVISCNTAARCKHASCSTPLSPEFSSMLFKLRSLPLTFTVSQTFFSASVVWTVKLLPVFLLFKERFERERGKNKRKKFEHKS